MGARPQLLQWSSQQREDELDPWGRWIRAALTNLIASGSRDVFINTAKELRKSQECKNTQIYINEWINEDTTNSKILITEIGARGKINYLSSVREGNTCRPYHFKFSLNIAQAQSRLLFAIIENMLLTNSSGLGFREDSGTIRKTLSEGLHRMYLNGLVLHGSGRRVRHLHLEGTACNCWHSLTPCLDTGMGLRLTEEREGTGREEGKNEGREQGNKEIETKTKFAMDTGY